MTAEEDSSGIEKTLKELEITSNRLPSVAVLDEFLPIEMNPFQRRPRSRSTGSICACLKRTHQLNDNSKSTFKRSSKKILRDPILKYVSKHTFDDLASNKSKLLDNLLNKSSENKEDKIDWKKTDFNSVLDGCERLSLGSEQTTSREGNNNNSNNQASCSQEAIAGMGLSPPCDVTMDELASYFETFVHIPKKMSSMAEMMYI